MNRLLFGDNLKWLRDSKMFRRRQSWVPSSFNGESNAALVAPFNSAK